jgi:hypothetical protein
MSIHAAKTFFFMAFDIVGYSKHRSAEHLMQESVSRVFTHWADYRKKKSKQLGISSRTRWYELPVGDELIVATEEHHSVAVLMLGFITEWNKQIIKGKKGSKEIYLRFALHLGPAIEIGIHEILGGQRERRPDNLIGDSVNMLARLLAVARPNQVLASVQFWDRIKGYLSRKEIALSDADIVGEGICFDRYSVKVKHTESLDAYNLMWYSADGPLGNPAPPDSPYSTRFTGENNYHQQESFGHFLRLSNDQLFEHYSTRLPPEGLVSYVKDGYFWRLPYVIKYMHRATREPVPVQITLSTEDFSGRFTDESMVKRFKRFRTSQRRVYEENELAAVAAIEWGAALRKPERLKLRKVLYSDVVSTDLAADFTAHDSDWYSLRETKFERKGSELWELGKHSMIPDALGTTCEIISGDSCLFHPWRSPLVHSHPATWTAGAS